MRTDCKHEIVQPRLPVHTTYVVAIITYGPHIPFDEAGKDFA